MIGPHQKASGQRGVVLAVNCTPPEADPQVYAFWMALHRHLAALGYRLVLASTMPLDAPEVDVIEIPFLLPDFPRRYPTSAKAPGVCPARPCRSLPAGTVAASRRPRRGMAWPPPASTP